MATLRCLTEFYGVETPHRVQPSLVLSGDPQVLQAMSRFTQLAADARGCILSGDTEGLGRLIDANIDLRLSICRIPAGQVEMVRLARKAGATAKFAGSGGAIIGTYPDEPTFRRLLAELAPIHCRVIRPEVEPPDGPAGDCIPR